MSARVDSAFELMFDGWDRVETWRDVRKDVQHVRLELDLRRVEAARHPADIANALWPKPMQVAPLRGIRFAPGRCSARSALRGQRRPSLAESERPAT